MMDKDHYVRILKDIQSNIDKVDKNEETWYERNSDYVNSILNKINRFMVSSASNNKISDEYTKIQNEAKKLTNKFVDKMNLEGDVVKAKNELVKPLNITTQYTNKCMFKLTGSLSSQILKSGIKYGTKDYGEENNKSAIVIILRIIACICLGICFLYVARFMVSISILIFKVFILLLKRIFKPSMRTFNISYTKECFKILKNHKANIGYGILFGAMSILLYLGSSNSEERNNLVGMIDISWLKDLVNSIKNKVYINE